jgi:hypothetical protein
LLKAIETHQRTPTKQRHSTRTNEGKSAWLLLMLLMLMHSSSSSFFDFFFKNILSWAHRASMIRQ